jgi:hypothetical protein
MRLSDGGFGCLTSFSAVRLAGGMARAFWPAGAPYTSPSSPNRAALPRASRPTRIGTRNASDGSPWPRSREVAQAEYRQRPAFDLEFRGELCDRSAILHFVLYVDADGKLFMVKKGDSDLTAG